jgi:hypothetical protein
VSFSGEASNHQGAHFKKSGNDASDTRQPRLPFRAKSFENILIEKKKRLDGLDAGCLVDDREVPVLDAVAERILQDFVVTVILAPVGEGGGSSGATGDFAARHYLYAKPRCGSRRVGYTCCVGQADCV